VALLISAVIFATVGILVSTVSILVVTTVYAALSGIVAARLLSNEIADIRRTWSSDRAGMANDTRRIAVVRAREQTAFAELMGARVSERDAKLAALRESLVTTEIDLARARERFSAERARNRALLDEAASAHSDLESARVDLRHAADALAESERAELTARAEILAWEEAASESERQQHQRLA